MRHQLAAGVSVTKMLERATTSGPADIRELSTRLLAAAKSGKPLAPALDAQRLPPTFVPMFRVGEEMGKLQEMLTALDTAGHGGDDHSGLVQFYETLAQTSVETSRASR